MSGAPRSAAKPGFRIVPHTAEVALNIRGRTWAEFYRNAALGLRAVYAPSGRPLRVEAHRCCVDADSPEETLVAWLNEIVFKVSAKRWFPIRIRVLQAGPQRLAAELTGGPMGSGRGRSVRVVGEVKAATFSDLNVRRAAGVWRATVVLDV